MNKLKKFLTAIGLAVIAIIISSSSVFATIEDCINNDYPYLSTEKDEDFSVKCITADIDGKSITIYAQNKDECIYAERIAENPFVCKEDIKATDLYRPCVGEGKKYSSLSLKKDEEYTVRCPSLKTQNGRITFWGKSAADCASAAGLASRPYACAEEPDTDFIEEYQQCMGYGRKYPNIYPVGPSKEYPVMCPAVNYNGKLVAFYGKTPADCASIAALNLDTHDCEGTDFRGMEIRRTIIYISIIVCISAIFIGAGILIGKKINKKTPSEPSQPSAPAAQN